MSEQIPSWWTKEREALLLELVATRPHIVDVANELGTTRNAVIGKIARMKRRGETVDRPARAPAAREPKPRQAKIAAAAEPVPDPAPQPVRRLRGDRSPDPWRTRFEPRIAMRRLTLMQLRRRVCRWPVGNPGDPGFFFCGNDTEPDRSYCEPHHDFAHT